MSQDKDEIEMVEICGRRLSPEILANFRKRPHSLTLASYIWNGFANQWDRDDVDRQRIWEMAKAT